MQNLIVAGTGNVLPLRYEEEEKDGDERWAGASGIKRPGED